MECYRLKEEKYLVDKVLESLSNLTDLDCHIEYRQEPLHYNNIYSEVILVLTGGFLGMTKIEFLVIAMRQPIDEITINEIIHYQNIYQTKFVLFLEYSSNYLINDLIENDIYFIDTTGNLYLKNPKNSDKGLYLSINGNRLAADIVPDVHNHALQKSGLPVLYRLLIDKNQACLPQRKIANSIKSSLGTVNNVFKCLRNKNYIHRFHMKGQPYLTRKQAFYMWKAGFKKHQRPGLLINCFSCENPTWHIHARLPEDVFWSGQIACSFHTNQHFESGRIIMYAHETPYDLINTYGLRPDPNGKIEILKTFWQKDEEQENGYVDIYGNVHPFLIMSDLLLDDHGYAGKFFYTVVDPLLKDDWDLDI